MSPSRARARRPAAPPPKPCFTPLGHLSPVAAHPQHLQFADAPRRRHVDLHVLAPDLFRFVVRPAEFTPPPSWAVVPREWPEVEVTVQRSGRKVAVITSAARFELDLATSGWRVVDRHDLTVFEAPAGGTGLAGPEARVDLRLAPRERLFGLGETTGPLDQRGRRREFWNIDVLQHASSIHPGLRRNYVSIPFALSLRDGRAAGLFLDHPGMQDWDLGESDPDRWRLTADGGLVDLYLFTGPGVGDVLARYSELTGRLPLPPRWALGYHQSRYSYTSRAELEAVATEFRRRRIPCDALYCDIHHMDGYRVFTFGKSYPRPGEMLAGLARRGFRVVAIADPGVKDDPKYGVLQRGRKVDAFVKQADGRHDVIGQVWPGASRFPDFLSAAVRDWWGREQQALLDLGVAGLWNDMNEPANNDGPDKTLPPDAIHRTDHGPRRHTEVHNVYGMEMARASRDGALRVRPDERPFVITRAGYAGVQRHALVWTGDNSSCWEHLAGALRQCLNLGLSGVAFCGADVGGFLDSCTPELFARWLQFAVFTPFLRNHSNLGTRAQEPWAFGPEIEAIARDALNLRYQLLPYLYGLFARAARDGTPILRPLFWHYPNDPLAVACEDQFLLGEHLLVAPVLHPGAVARSIYLPRGEWFDFWTGEKAPGAVHLTAHAPLARIPVFVKAGAILPLTATRPHVGRREPDTVVLHVWPDDHGHLEWYDDDGRTLAHARGVSERRTITTRPGRRSGSLRIGPVEGTYRGSTRLWRVLLRGANRPVRVRSNGADVDAEFVPELNLVAFDLPACTEAVEAHWR